MDKAGLRELVKAGVRLATRRWKEPQPKNGMSLVGTEPEIVTVIDRLTQLGLISLEHQEPSIWSEVLNGLHTVYRLGVQDSGHPERHPDKDIWIFIDVIYRVLFLGAVAVRLKRFEQVRPLVLQQPLENRPDQYWTRFAVTMASRGNIGIAFKGKSLIGPASEVVRDRPQFLGAFEENLDTVVNYMCQFDFLQCVTTFAEAKTLWACYPNFGGYYDYRTMPIVLDLIRNGPSRAVVPGTTEAELARILLDLDALVREHFFEVSGWDRYTPEVYEFIKAKLD